MVVQSDLVKSSTQSFVDIERGREDHSNGIATTNAKELIFRNQRTINEEYKSEKSNINFRSAENEANSLQEYSVGVIPNRFPTKRYVSTCMFKTIVQPVWFRESVHLKIGSTKRRYDETVVYMRKLVPSHWRETATWETNNSDYKMNYITKLEIPLHIQDGIHYISLEPQQQTSAA